MKSVIQWAIKNSPAMNALLIVSMIIGAISMVIMRREVFPNFALEVVLVTVPLPGETPDEIEEAICQKIEAEVATIEGIKKISSIAAENIGYVILELDNNVESVQKILSEVESNINQVNFSEIAEEPIVQQIIFRAPAISVGILAPERPGAPTLEEELELRAIAEEVRRELLDLKAVPPSSFARRALAKFYQPKGNVISSAEIEGERPFEVAVEISEDSLRKYGLTLEGVANEIRMQTSESPGGALKTDSQELVVRGSSKDIDGDTIRKLPLINSNGNGAPVTVGEVANVIDGFEETSDHSLINGREGLVIRIAKTKEEDLFTIVESVQAYVAEKQLPPGYTLDTWGNISIDVRDRIDLLTRNGLQGLILVFIVLAVFLELRLAFWVAMGIPISILGAGFILLITGQTMNMLTMFAFLMALGIVVDDAIVIGENIYAKREEGLSYIAAAISGTYEVLPSVCASVTTTIVAFMPLMYVSGVMGKFIAIMPVAVIAMLVISLFESAFILPSHLAHDDNLFTRIMGVVLYVFKPLVTGLTWLNKFAAAAMTGTINRFYQPLLHFSLNNKSIVLSTVFAIMMFAVGLVFSGIAPYSMFPQMDGREINASVSFPDGSRAQFTEEALRELEAAFRRVDAKVQQKYGKSVISNLYRNVGEVGEDAKGPAEITRGAHVGSIEIELTQPDEREVTTDQLNKLWREEIPKIAGTESLKFAAKSIGPGGSGIEFKLLFDESSVDYIDQAAEECKAYLAKKVGLSDFEDDSKEGKAELTVELNEQGRTLGLSQAMLSNTLRSGFFGAEIKRDQRGRHEVKLMVRYPSEAREDMEEFEKIRIQDNAGIERPLLDVATPVLKPAPSKINRLHQRRSVTISAEVDKDKANAAKIIEEMKADFLPEMIARYRKDYDAKLSVNWEGQAAQTIESVDSMKKGFIVAMLAMYILLTLQFRSYLQPLIILAIIPFGVLGAILGHAIMQVNLSLFSFFGMIALTGVVVNDSIVLVDCINRELRRGLPLFDALISAGKRRFRPIMLTSFTTVAGLSPMLFETSLQAQVLIPMAISLVFGLATGTLLILILVPIFYYFYGTMLAFFGVPFYPDDSEIEAMG